MKTPGKAYMKCGFFSMLGFVLALAAASNGAIPQPAVRDSIADAFIPITPDTNNYSSYLGLRLKINAVDRLINHYNKYNLVTELLKAYEHRPGAQEWAGEYPGKYLHAATMAWVYSKAPELKAKVDSVSRRLIATQLSNGYLGTYLPQDYWTSWDVWAHKYCLIGLETYYRYTGDTTSLNACKKAANLLCSTFGTGLKDLSASSSGIHEGMPSTSVLEPIVMLYRLTGDQKYLNFAKYIISLLDGAGNAPIVNDLVANKGVNQIANGKAYEMMSNIVGVADYYRMTGNPRYLDACVKAWANISTKVHYITGTSSYDEHFAGDYDLLGDPDGDKGPGEACVTTTWLQLTWHLFRLTGEAKYADEIERIIYNALLGAQRPAKGFNSLLQDSCIGDIVYCAPLTGTKLYGIVSHIVRDISCCSASQPRGIALVSQMMLGVSNNKPTVVLYTPASATLPINAGGENIAVKVDVATQYPADGNAIITLNPPKAANFTVRLRVPSWCTYYQANALGNKYMGTKGTFLEITGNWKPGDFIQVYMYMSYQTIPGGTGKPLGLQYASKVAVQRGPQILATDARAATALPARWVGGLFYNVPGIRNGQAIQLNLVPYSDAGQQSENFSVYIDNFTIDTTKLPPINPPSVGIAPALFKESRPDCFAASLQKNVWRISVTSAKLHTISIYALNGSLLKSFHGKGKCSYSWQSGHEGVSAMQAEIDGALYTKKVLTVGADLYWR